MVSKKRKIQNRKNIPLLVISVAIIAVGVFLGIKVFYSNYNTVQSTYYHGPNPNIKLAMDNAEGILGRKSKKKVVTKPKVAATPKATTKPTASVKPSVTVTPTTTVTTANSGVQLVPTVDILQMPAVVNKSTLGYGIAAGGGLPFLSQAELNKYFDNLKSLGVGWVRWDFDWNVIQNTSITQYDWVGIDMVVNTAKRYGIKTLGIITYAPRWARDPACATKFSCQPADPHAFGVFAGEVALRYKNSVSYWEIWNEPNYSFFWSPSPNVSKYFEVLKEASLEIKRVNPQAVVLTGGLSASEDDSKGNLSPITFITRLYGLGARQYFDAISLHPYTYPASPNNASSWNHWNDSLPIHNLMASNGDSTKKIWLTEFGAATGGPGVAYIANQLSGFQFGSDFMSLDAQSQMITEATTFYTRNSSWMGPFFWYSLWDEGTARTTPENFFGLLNRDWTPKPAFTVYKNIIAK